MQNHFNFELFRRIKFWKNVDRLGPEIPYTHWRLYFKPAMRRLCKAKFKHFDDTAEFRPGAYAVCCSRISIGKNVVIRPNSMLFADDRKEYDAEIVIEDDVLLSPGVQIYVDNHVFDNPDIPIINQGHTKPEGVILRRGCWIGANSIILAGVRIGENTVIGAGSVVTQSIPDRVLAAGNPARLIRKLN